MKKTDWDWDLGALLQELLRRHCAFSPNPLGAWEDLVGEQVARYSVPQTLKKGVLTVVAYDSVWRHHLELLKGDLLERIRADRPGLRLEKIVIQVGELPEAPPVLNPSSRQLEKAGSGRAPSRRRKKAPQRPLTSHEKALLKTLPDPELRAIATRLLKHIPLESPPAEENPPD